MRHIPKIEIDVKAQKLFDDLVATYTLKGAKKIAMELRRLLLAEEKRRAKLRG